MHLKNIYIYKPVIILNTGEKSVEVSGGGKRKAEEKKDENKGTLIHKEIRECIDQMHKDENICGRHVFRTLELKRDIDQLEFSINELERQFQEMKEEHLVLDSKKDEVFDGDDFERRCYLMYLIKENRKMREEYKRLIAEKRRGIFTSEGPINYAKQSYNDLLIKRKVLSSKLSLKYKK